MQELEQKITKLKREREAIILAHNYQLDEVQSIADYTGDSFYLSKIATSVECKTIVFAGVLFMAETAKILSPKKTVLLPEMHAGCPLADTISADDVRKLRQTYPLTPIVCYINTSAAVKAECDVCCTSSNAIKVMSSLSEHKVIFVPDENLGHYAAKQLPHKELVLWSGSCATHVKVSPADVISARNKYPNAKILVHPECLPSVTELADFVGSTSEIIHYAENSREQIFIIGTEVGVLFRLRASKPNKQFHLLHPGLVCPEMKKTRLKSVYNALLCNQYQIEVEEAIAAKARLALTRMLELA